MVKITIEIDGRTAAVSDVSAGRDISSVVLADLCVDCIGGFGAKLSDEVLAYYFGSRAGIAIPISENEDDDRTDEERLRDDLLKDD